MIKFIFHKTKPLRDCGSEGFLPVTDRVTVCGYCKFFQSCKFASYLGENGFCSYGEPFISITERPKRKGYYSWKTKIPMKD